MMYELEIADKLYKVFSKLSKRDNSLMVKVNKKILQIRKYPLRFKPLKGPMKNKRRAHIGSFVLIFSVDEKNKIVRFWASRRCIPMKSNTNFL